MLLPPSSRKYCHTLQEAGRHAKNENRIKFLDGMRIRLRVASVNAEADNLTRFTLYYSTFLFSVSYAFSGSFSTVRDASFLSPRVIPFPLQTFALAEMSSGAGGQEEVLSTLKSWSHQEAELRLWKTRK